MSEAVNGNSLPRESLVHWITTTLDGVLDFFSTKTSIWWAARSAATGLCITPCNGRNVSVI
ncbi:MAG: hypothetical protein Q9P14_08630 [candidate division KSB1 bacterium]|nr:hypothetical protein [candidate division KSB1 bacterium]